MPTQEKLAPHLLLKTNLVNPPQCWNVLWNAYPSLLDRLHNLGIYGVEVAIRCNGDVEADVTVLNELCQWIRPWYDAGLRVYLHPYTSGAANPAVCEGETGGAPIESFKRVADVAMAMAELTGERVLTVYHAAELLPSSACPDPRLERDVALRNSQLFFNLAVSYLETCGDTVELLSETQLPTRVEDKRVRIGDRPDEVLATVQNSSVGICWDTGHYLLSCERVGVSQNPPQAFTTRVRHMHLHDVIDHQDHRLLRHNSHHVATYVGLAFSQGNLNSITLEYDYGQGEFTGNAELILRHVEEACALVRSWTSSSTKASGIA